VDIEDGEAILAELQRPDELTCRFSPYGVGALLTPADAARSHAACVARAVLADDVPGHIRDNVERARKLYLYGVLEYGFFTAASDYALLVLEGAVRLRFLSHYHLEIPVVDVRGRETRLQVQSFDDVRSNRRYKLRGADGATYRLP